MSKIDDILLKLQLNTNVNVEPQPDLANCSKCGWKGSISECEEGTDGDWESGYYKIHECPICDDGGCIDDYDMSDEQLKIWEEWHKQKKEYIT